jgi:hypothetical protein
MSIDVHVGCQSQTIASNSVKGAGSVCDPEQARQILQQALNQLRRAIQVGEIAPGPYREIKARFDHRMERLERKIKRPLLDGLATPSQA